MHRVHRHSRTPPAAARPPWLAAWWPDFVRPRPDAPEVRRVKVAGYLFAILAAAPGLTLILRELLAHHAYVYAGLHGAVMLGAGLLFPFAVLRPERVAQAERVFAALLVLSAVGFLVLYARQPQVVLGHQDLGSVLLFVVSGLLLVLPPRVSIPVSVALLVGYRIEVGALSGVPAEQLQLSQWVNTGMFALLMVGVVMRQTLSQLTERLHLLEELSCRDALTGLLNRRGFERRAGQLRSGAAGALLVLDIDNFKPINDAHGHMEGDRILGQVGDLLARSVDGQGVAARWGGEEFVLYLHGSGATPGLEFAEALRARVAGSVLGAGGVTVSVGVSVWPHDEPLHHAFLRADDAMYAAKRAGKNRVQGAAEAVA